MSDEITTKDPENLEEKSSDQDGYTFKLSKKKNVVPFKTSDEIEANKTEVKETQLINMDDSTLEESSDYKEMYEKKSPRELNTMILELQNQLSKLNNRMMAEDVTPEFKALMEAYIKKANESEELKVKLEEAISSKCSFDDEVKQLRELNRELTSELQSVRDALRVADMEASKTQEKIVLSEEDSNRKLRNVIDEKQKLQDKVYTLENETAEMKDIMEKRVVELIKSQETLKQEISDMDFDFRQRERDLMNEIDGLNKQVKHYESLLKEQEEKIELRTKEAEYKATLLNQLAKQATQSKKSEPSAFLNGLINPESKEKKKRFWF